MHRMPWGVPIPVAVILSSLLVRTNHYQLAAQVTTSQAKPLLVRTNHKQLEQTTTTYTKPFLVRPNRSQLDQKKRPQRVSKNNELVKTTSQKKATTSQTKTNITKAYTYQGWLQMADDKGCAVISVSFIAIKLTNIVIKLTIIVNFTYKYCLFKTELYLNIAQWRTRNVR